MAGAGRAMKGGHDDAEAIRGESQSATAEVCPVHGVPGGDLTARTAMVVSGHRGLACLSCLFDCLLCPVAWCVRFLPGGSAW